MVRGHQEYEKIQKNTDWHSSLHIIGCVSYIAYYYMKQDRNEKVYEEVQKEAVKPVEEKDCLLYTSPSPRDCS